MRILVIGSGGREHAILWKLKQSPKVEQLYVMPGNGGTSRLATSVAIAPENHAAVITFCKEKNIALVMIGPEAPLVDGLADSLDAAGIPVFGPSKAAAQLEGSKEFTKKLCDNHNIPTAAYHAFTEAEPAQRYVEKHGAPIVIKADGLAAGKGVILAQSKEEAFAAIDDILVHRQFGEAGNSIVIEEFLVGEEISVFAICDGKTCQYFGSAQDHKAVGDGDTGPNTGGMGTYSPAPVMNDALQEQIMREVITPAVEGMRKDGIPYKGVLFAGLMITKTGPKLLEINVRFGDPETQVLMARLDTDLVPILYDAAKGTLKNNPIPMKNQAALCVVMAAEGYPGDYKKGSCIGNLPALENMQDIVVFHAGTKRTEDGKIIANGGRVLGITALAPTVTEAQKKAYTAVDQLQWPEGFCRRDIGWRAVAREKK